MGGVARGGLGGEPGPPSAAVTAPAKPLHGSPFWPAKSMALLRSSCDVACMPVCTVCPQMSQIRFYMLHTTTTQLPLLAHSHPSLQHRLLMIYAIVCMQSHFSALSSGLQASMAQQQKQVISQACHAVLLACKTTDLSLRQSNSLRQQYR